MAFVELTIRTGSTDEQVWTEQAWFNTNNILFVQSGAPAYVDHVDSPESVSTIWTTDNNAPWLIMEPIAALLDRLKHAEKRWSDA